MSGEFNSREDSYSTKLEWRPQIFVKLSFRDLCGSKLSDLHLFDNMSIIHWVKYRLKAERLAVSSWDTNPWSNICDPHWELISRNRWHLGTSEISTALEIVVGTYFHAWHGAKTVPVFLPADGGASWFLLSTSVQPENTNAFILKVTGQVWKKPKKDEHQH